MDEDRQSRISFLQPPALRRRCIKIEIEDSGPRRLEATISSRRWSPPRSIAKVIGILPGFRLARGLRWVFGKVTKIKVRFDGPASGDGACLRVGDELYPPGTIGSVALQGWQEDSGHDRVWDVMLLGPNRDLLVGHRSYDEALDLAQKVAQVLNVPFEESSVIGGAVTPSTATFSVRDAHYDGIKPDGWRHLK